MHVFCYQGRDFRGRVADNIKERDDIWSPCEVLKNLDLSLDLLFLHGLQHLDNTFLLVDDVDTLKDLILRPLIAPPTLQNKYGRVPLNTCLARPSSLSHNDPVSPTAPGDYLVSFFRIRYMRDEREKRGPYSYQEGPSLALTSA